MRGRGDNRVQTAGRGRGFHGRGGRGIGKLPARTGTVPSIGAYLDVTPGKDVNPGWVTSWMRKMNEYTMAQYESRIHLIFGPDGSLGNYPEIVEPQDPPEDATKVDQKKWEAAYSEWRKETIRLDQDKTRLYGLMLGQMSDNSKNRVKETQDGMESMETNDPLQLLSAIIATHMTDNRLGAEHNVFKVSKIFRELIMQHGESLASYHLKFRSLYSGLCEAYRRADEDMPDSDFQDGQLALQFTMGLNSSYAGHKQYFEDAVKQWPESVDQAFLEASKYKPKKDGYDNDYQGGLGRANAFAMRGRGRGRGGRGRGGRDGAYGRYSSGRGYRPPVDLPISEPGSSTTYGTRKGNCNSCGEAGHYSYECRAQVGQKTGAADGNPGK